MKNKNAITLVALVVTIVILLILAGITIASLTQTGLFTKVKDAKEKTICSQAEEKVKLAVDASFDSTASLNKDKLKENLNKIDGINPKVEVIAYNLTVNVDGYQFVITESGQVTMLVKSENEEDNQKHEEEKNSLVLLDHFDDNKGIIINSDKITTEDKKVGNSSLYLNNTEFVDENTYKFQFDDDFTIEYWLKESSENLKAEWAVQLAVATNNGIMCTFNNGKFVIRGWSVANYLSLDPPPMDEWVHIAVTRKDGIIYVFYNGILQGTTNNTTKFSNGKLCLGFEGSTFHTKDSYIDELKILNGKAKYTENFDITRDEEYYSDEVVYHFEKSTEINQNTSKTSYENKKFGKASSYFNNSYINYGVKGNNYKFDKDFTIDYWVNISAENLKETWSIQLAVAEYNGIMIVLNDGKFVVRGWKGINYLTTDPPPINEWVHIAVTRKDGIIHVFYNGKLQKTVENSMVFNNGSLYLGYEGTAFFSKSTYIDELRILNGYCAWTENFEVPSKPYEY